MMGRTRAMEAIIQDSSYTLLQQDSSYTLLLILSLAWMTPVTFLLGVM